MKTLSQKTLSTIKIIIVGLVIGLSVNYIFAAWTAPSSTPPSGNTDAPLNVSSTGQIKTGGLTLNTGGATNGLIVSAGNVGIGTSSPAAKLDVAGTVKATNLQITSGAGTSKVLTSDASGNASWSSVASGSVGGGCYYKKITGQGSTSSKWGNGTDSTNNGGTCTCASGYTSQLISDSGVASTLNIKTWLCIAN